MPKGSYQSELQCTPERSGLPLSKFWGWFQTLRGSFKPFAANQAV